MFLEGLDELDEKIVRLLLENARMSYSEIGQKVGLSRVAAKMRVQALEQRGIIEGYRPGFRRWSRKALSRNIPPSSIPRKSAGRYPAILNWK